MLKIDPIKPNLKIDVNILKNKSAMMRLTTAPYALGLATVGATGLAISTFLKEACFH